MEFIELPKYVYKYINWEKEHHKKIILDNEIYFTSARNFNDPFDSTVPFRYELGNDEQALSLYIEFIRHEHPLLSDEEVLRVARNELRDNDIRDVERVPYNINVQRDFAATNFGIFSVSKIYDSILMWAHYANYHKGVCVRINCQKFREFMENECVKNDFIIYWENVVYQKEYPILNPYLLRDYEVYFKSLLVKSEEWGYESELRFILCNDSNKPLILPNGIIDQIIIGCRISSNNEKELIEVAEEKNVELIQAVLNQNSFSLNFNKKNV